MEEIEITNKLSNWLEIHFKNSDLLIEKDVSPKLGSNTEQFRTDLVAVQSKSNVIHAFEIKCAFNLSNLNSLIWQIETLYGNYKWLVITEEYKIKKLVQNLKEKGLGLLIYIAKDDTFIIDVQPNYIDGNLMKFYPTINEKWKNKHSHASSSRPNKKN